MRIKKQILAAIICSLGFGAATSINFQSAGMATNYLHVMQNQLIEVYDLSTAISINIGGKISVQINKPSATWNVSSGQDQLDAYTVSVNPDSAYYSFAYRLKWVNTFIQDQSYEVSINNANGDVTTNTLIYNESFVMKTLTINSDPLYQYRNGSALWFKGGIGAAQMLTCSGSVSYKYDEGIFPLQEVSVRLYFDGIAEGSVTNVDSSGKFTFSNFTLPRSIGGNSPNVELRAALQVAQGTAFLDPQSVNTLNINLDNSAPQAVGTVLALLPDLTQDSSHLLSEIGWYSQLTVSVRISADNATDSGSGLRAKYLFKSSEQEFYSTSNLTVNIKTLEGGGREIQAFILDNVHNMTTLSVLVSVDITPPGSFLVNLDQDSDNTPTQSTPETGWYNDETVSFSWTQPSDLSLRDLPYQIQSDAGWPTWSAQVGETVVLNQFQGTRNANQLWVSEGGSVIRRISVRAIDRAGNIREAYVNVLVDKTPPTVNSLALREDKTLDDSLVLPEKGWYNDGSEVEWTWSAFDAGGLSLTPYAYRNSSGNSAVTSNWINLTDVNVDTSVSVSGNTFNLLVRDKAGNIAITSGVVYVSESSPSFSVYDIIFQKQGTAHNSDGVFPSDGWYNQSTVDIVLTWNVDASTGGLSRLFIKNNIDSGYVSQNSRQPTFSAYSIIPQNYTPIIFTALFVDKAGRGKSVNKYIYADILPPANLGATLVPGKDSAQDGITPLDGWYDSDEIALSWQQPIEGGKLRDFPYRIKVNNQSWSTWNAVIGSSNIKVSPNQQNTIIVQVADEAGNLATSSVSVTVDTGFPTGTFTLRLEEDVPHFGGVAPDKGWYSDNTVLASFVNIDVADDMGLRAARYFIKNNFGKTSYGEGFSASVNLSSYSTEGGSLPNYLEGAIADHAGNIIKKTVPFYVDKQAPNTFFAQISDQSTDVDGNGYLPETGWYNTEQVSVEWNQAGDDGQLPAKPYRLRSDTTTNWTSFQSELSAELPVLEGGNLSRNVYIQARDRAGNLVTVSVAVKVDKTPPQIITFGVEEQTKIVDSDIPDNLLPLPGWFSTTSVIVKWDAVSENGQLRTAPYRIKTSLTEYSDFLSATSSVLRVSENGHTTVDVLLFALDRAGNSSVATLPVWVDLTAPGVTLSYTVARTFFRPYVATTDILLVTLDISEEVQVSPMLRFTCTLNGESVTYSVPLALTGQSWTATFDVLGLEDGRCYFSVVVFDNAGNKATFFNGDPYFIVQSVFPPRAASFSVYDEYTFDTRYTQASYVSVTFNVDAQVTKYFITEESVTRPVVLSTNFKAYPPTQNTYSFLSEKNGKKTLYLWVANDKDGVSQEPSTCSIYFDNTPPIIQIRPDRDHLALSDNYRDVTVGKGTLFAQLELESSGDAYYIEEAMETPSMQALLPAISGWVTQDLYPFLASDNSRSVWWVTYNTSLSQVSGMGRFLVSVTDNALNSGSNILKGGTFNINLEAAPNPVIALFALDGRSNYTKGLTINVVITKDPLSLTNIEYYTIFDGVYKTPAYSEVTTPWPNGVSRISVNYRIENSNQLNQVAEGVKTIHVWTRRGAYLNSGMVNQTITFDRTSPTISVKVDPYRDKNSSLTEVLRATMTVSERLNTSPTPMLYVLKEDRVTTMGSYVPVYLGQVGAQHVYQTTLNISGDIKLKNNVMRLKIEDLAGNETDQTLAVRQQMILSEYRDEVVTASPFAEQGQLDFVWMSCTVSASDLPVHLKGIRLIASGQFVPSDIQNFKVYLDGDNNQKFEYNNGYGYDTLKGISERALDSSGVVYIPFANTEEILSSSTRRFFVVSEIGTGAVPKNTMKLSFATRNAFELEASEGVDYSSKQVSFNTKTVTFVKTVSWLYFTHQSGGTNITTTVNRGAQKALLQKWMGYTGKGTAIWSGVRITCQGSMNPTFFSNLAIYKDADFNKEFNEDVDTLISYGNDRFESGRQVTTINLRLNQSLDEKSSDLYTYFLVADLSKDTPIGATFSVRIATPNDLMIDTPNIVVSALLPIISPTFDVQQYISKVDLVAVNNKQGDVYQGARLVLQKFNLGVDFFNPQLKYIDYALEGSATNTDFKGNGDNTGIAIYSLSDNITYTSNYFDLDRATRLEAVNTWLDSGSRVRILFDEPYVLGTSNSFALVVTMSESAYRDRDFRLTTYFQTATPNPYIFIVNGKSRSATTVSTNLVTIIDKQKPSQPVISGNAFSSYVQKVAFSFDSYTKYGSSGTGLGNNIIRSKFSVGTEKDLEDILIPTERDLAQPRPFVVEESIVIDNRDGLRALDDHTTYYVTLRAVAERQGESNLESKAAYYSFKTDFSPPQLPNPAPSIIVESDGFGGIYHQISWENFVEEESGIARYIIEERSNYSPSWHVAAINTIANPALVKTNERRLTLSTRKPNMSYSYRIKAENLAGLQSDYLYSSSVTTVKTDQVFSNVSNYPNPFNSRKETTKIFYYLNQDTGVEIKIYDSMGHYVLKKNYPKGMSSKSTKGDCEMEWDGKNDAGDFVAKGGYFVVIEAPDAKGESKKVVRMVGVIH